MGPDGKELGEIATDVLFENDRVKIWNLTVEPGESSDWHLHGRDYVTVVVKNPHCTVRGWRRSGIAEARGDSKCPDTKSPRRSKSFWPVSQT